MDLAISRIRASRIPWETAYQSDADSCKSAPAVISSSDLISFIRLNPHSTHPIHGAQLCGLPLVIWFLPPR